MISCELFFRSNKSHHSSYLLPSTQSRNYENLLAHFFNKNFVNVFTKEITKELISWHINFWRGLISHFPHCVQRVPSYLPSFLIEKRPCWIRTLSFFFQCCQLWSILWKWNSIKLKITLVTRKDISKLKYYLDMYKS